MQFKRCWCEMQLQHRHIPTVWILQDVMTLFPYSIRETTENQPPTNVLRKSLPPTMIQVTYIFLVWTFKVPFNFTSFFIVFLKSTAGVMKNDVYSFVISLSFSSYRTFYILSCDVTSMSWDNGNNKKVWYLGEYLRWLPRVLFPGVTFFIYM
jgi:hypothetical protein